MMPAFQGLCWMASASVQSRGHTDSALQHFIQSLFIESEASSDDSDDEHPEFVGDPVDVGNLPPDAVAALLSERLVFSSAS
jgi:hypothetical protein